MTTLSASELLKDLRNCLQANGPVGERVRGNPGDIMFIKFAIYDLAACIDCIPDESDTCREDHQRGYDGSIDQGRWRKVKLRTGSVTDSYHSLFSKKTFRHVSRPVQIVCSVSFRALCVLWGTVEFGVGNGWLSD